MRIQEGVGLMAGQEDSLDRAAREDCEVWYEWMVANLLYTRPALRFYSLLAMVKLEELSGMTTRVAGGHGE